MTDEAEPVSDDEWLLRRVRVEQFRTAKVPLVSPNAFEPRTAGRDPDTDGLSVFRAACVPAPEAILEGIAEGKRGEYGIVRFPASLLRGLGLSVRAAPVPPIPGHAVVPELNAADYAADKARFTGIKLALAEFASRPENVVVWPAALRPADPA